MAWLRSTSNITLFRWTRSSAMWCAPPRCVDDSIVSALPDETCVIFDRPIKYVAHYVNVSSTVEACNSILFENVCLTSSAIRDETFQNVKDHFRFYTSLLSTFDILADHVPALIRDNCANNQHISNMLKSPPLWCAGYGFQLSAWRLVAEIKDMVTSIQELIVKLQLFLLRAKLRVWTDLYAWLRNVARLQFVYIMLQYYTSMP